MEELKNILEGIFDEEEKMKSMGNVKDVHVFFTTLDALDKVGEKSKYGARKYNEDALGNKLNIGDLVLIKSRSTNKYEVSDRFGIIYRIYDIPDRLCGGTICVYVGKNRDFDENLKYYDENKLNINDPSVIRNLAKVSCLSSYEVILVKKAKQVSPATISKIL